jgi:hypothetical protein
MRIRLAIAMFSIVALYSAGIASAGELVLAENGRSPYRIVVADNASPSTQYAAAELQKYLQQMSGAKLAIVSDGQPAGAKEIVLGENAHFRALGTKIDVAALGKEGYVLRTVGDNLVILGGAQRGNLYGVYGLLEDHLGCRWFAPDVSRIPKIPRLAIGTIDDRQIPVLEYREPLMADCSDPDWCAHNRLNSSNSPLAEKYGGKVAFGSGFFVHTFSALIPPEKYFKEHPEYFSLVKRKRKNGYAQLCCTNPDVIRICTERVREAMRREPNATVFSVSQNDCDQHCECANCQALATQEGTQMGPVLNLVNHVAAAVEKEFPDKIVETLAYQWTRKPPQHMRPRPNMVIRLCPIECCFSHPLETCDSRQNRSFRADIEAWAKVAPRLWIWDYTTDFGAYLLPFPNHWVLAPNVQFFVAHNVKGIFEEDSHDTRDSELAALGGYLMAKCLWDPNYDMDKAMGDFLDGYYGKASTPIETYIDMIHDYAEQENAHVMIYVGADSRHLSDDLLMQANQLWQDAEALAAGDAAVLQRVKIGRLSVDYALLERARKRILAKKSVSDEYRKIVQARFQPYCDTLAKSHVTRLREGKALDKEAYRSQLAKDLQIKP